MFCIQIETPFILCFVCIGGGVGGKKNLTLFQNMDKCSIFIAMFPRGHNFSNSKIQFSVQIQRIINYEIFKIPRIGCPLISSWWSCNPDSEFSFCEDVHDFFFISALTKLQILHCIAKLAL